MSNSVLQKSKQRRLFTHKDLKDFFSLKADNGSIAAGSDGITETAALTKGDGFIDPNSDSATREGRQDEGETMKNVLKSLAGRLDHDHVVEGKWAITRSSVREMETKAKRIAQEALQNLQQSVTSRFAGRTAQSNSLLSSIAKRNSEIINAGGRSKVDEAAQNARLLNDLDNFVRIHSPTTDEILVGTFLLCEPIQSILALILN